VPGLSVGRVQPLGDKKAVGEGCLPKLRPNRCIVVLGGVLTSIPAIPRALEPKQALTSFVSERYTMNRRERIPLNNQSNQHRSLRDAVSILGVLGVFIVGLIAGGFLFTFGGNASSSNNFNDGRTALAFFPNGTANNGQR
jgi:hypothetical protein